MSNSVKVALYVVLVILAGVSGYFDLTNFGRLMDRAGNRTSELEQNEPERKPEEAAPEATPAPEPATNRVAPGTPLDTNVAAVSNALSLLTNQATATAATNSNAL